MEEPYFIRLSIEHYRALLGTKLGENARSTVQRLLTEAEMALAGSPYLAKARSAARNNGAQISLDR